MIQIIHGNLLDSDADIICHQVNCAGAMGSGVAKQIKLRWPCVYEQYVKLCDAMQPGALLGFAQSVKTEDGRCVCNLFGQLNYGRDGKRYTSISALSKSCRLIAKQARPGATIAMPYRIGCGLGGGDWGEVLDMLTEVFKDRHLTLYKLA